MAKQTRRWCLCILVVMLGLAISACNMGTGADDGQPTVTILSPEPRSSVRVDQPLDVGVMAEDPGGAGVSRVDLQLDGMVVDTFEAAGPQAQLSVSMGCTTPSEEGASTLTAIAYREDGTASVPATIALNVTDAANETNIAQGPPAEAVAGTAIQARARLDADILDRPGIGCPVIGQVARDDVIRLLRRTTHPTQHWYQTDYLGENDLGWVYNDPLTVLDDDGDLPRDPEATCLFCGDGTCSAAIGETCGTCAADCSECGPLDADGSLCGDGVCQVGESADWCGDCVGEGPRAGTVCGDGVCSETGGETCSTCQADCGYCMIEGHICGDGVCNEPNENCSNCPADCDEPGCFFNDFTEPIVGCGDGVCGDNETVESCPSDCMPFDALLCLNATCGDGACDAACGEVDTCPADCVGACGNGICESHESLLGICPQDCGP